MHSFITCFLLKDQQGPQKVTRGERASEEYLHYRERDFEFWGSGNLLCVFFYFFFSLVHVFCLCAFCLCLWSLFNDFIKCLVLYLFFLVCFMYFYYELFFNAFLAFKMIFTFFYRLTLTSSEVAVCVLCEFLLENICVKCRV